MKQTSALAALSFAFATLACAGVWLVADVELNFDGHLSGLFYTGMKTPLPSGPVGDHTWRVHDDKGYDGEFYHLIAHDPLNRQGFLAYVDNPLYRWRRIGIPALAYVLAGGNDTCIDGMFVALQLGFLFAGAFWLSRYAQEFGRNPAWGLSFLAIPGVAISLDRMTVDLPVAALTVGLLLYSGVTVSRWRLYTVLIAAPLIRETGLILIFGWCVWRMVQRDLRGALTGAACAIPAVAWYLYAALHTQPDPTSFLAGYPFGGLVTWTRYALAHPRESYGARASTVLEFLALGGIWLAFLLSMALVVRLLRSSRDGLPEILAVAFTVFASLIGYQDIWATAYGIGRTLSPLLMALAAISLRDGSVLYGLPLLAIVPRIALQFAAEIRVALHGAG
jgi:hypothetical protein